MRFSWRRWRLPLVAALTAAAMSLALAGPAAASEPGESGSWSPEWVGNQDLSAHGSISQARNGGFLIDVWRGASGNQVWMSINNTNPFTLGTTQTNNSPTVVAWGSNSFMVFHVGVDNNIYYTVVNPSNQNWWGTWYPVPNQSTNMPVSVTQLGASSQDLYMVYHANDSTDRVWGTQYQSSGGTWTAAENISGGLSPAAPVVAFNPTNYRIYVAARGEDNEVWTTYSDRTGYWTSWVAQGGYTYVSPGIAALPDGNMLLSNVDENSYRPTYRTYDRNGNSTGGWSTDNTGWQTVYPVFLSVVGYAVYALLTGQNGFVYNKQAYQG
jgi:hypothetical protein